MLESRQYFQEKRSYCLDKESRKSSEEEEAQSIIGVTEEEAIAYAKEQVERFYQVDISEYEVISENMELNPNMQMTTILCL